MPVALFATDERGRPPHGILWRLAGVLTIAWAVFTALSVISYAWRDISAHRVPPNPSASNWLGVAGAWHAYGLLMALGAATWLLALGALAAGGRMVYGRALGWRPCGMALGVVTVAGILQWIPGPLVRWAGPDGANLGGNTGGVLGQALAAWLEQWMGRVGAASVLTAACVIALIVAIGPRDLLEGAVALRAMLAERRRHRLDEETLLAEEQARLRRDLAKQSRRQVKDEERQRREQERERQRLEREAQKLARLAEKEARRRNREEAVRQVAERRDALFEEQLRKVAQEKTQDAERRRPAPAPAPTPKAPAPTPTTNYTPPGVTLLQPPPPFTPGVDDTAAQGKTIVKTLEQFGIPVEITGVIRGPVITRYEILPAPGIKVNRVTSYSDNLQMALRAVSIRILTPIPGQGVMGIEVPNQRARVVSIREVAESTAWRQAGERMALPLLLGKDVAGDNLIIDLARMPHLLIAGATGSGKSACINAILAGLLLSRTPDQMRLLMVDPKMVEFTPYAELPHLVVPVITDAKRVAVSLQWAISEMNRRLKLFSRAGVRNIADFNQRDRLVQTTFLDGDAVVGEPVPARLPYIVVLIDEMADLMLVAQAEIENRIARLAQLSRAAGIHMILATQRPSVNIITGTIKANFPGRIAFQVTQKVDSRTILDASGADALIGRGDMLLLNPHGSSLVRAQGAWVADAEIRTLVAHLKAQGKPVYEASIKERLDKVAAAEPTDEFEGAGGATNGEGGEDADADAELLRKALAIIRETRRATTSSLQRRLRIGYNRAARLMDELEQRGYIGPANGNDPREILVDLADETPDGAPV